MAKGHKPKAGSRAFWPKKRAKRIYPRLKHIKISGDAVAPVEFAGYKAGMTSALLPDKAGHLVKSATVLDCPPLIICGAKFYRGTVDGLKDAGTIWAEKLEKLLSRKINPPKDTKTKAKLSDFEKKIESLEDLRLLVHTQPKESGIGKKKPELFEIALSGSLKKKFEYIKEKLGSQLKPEDVFKEGEFIDVSAVTRGKGFQGPVKRFGIKIRSRKNKLKRRHVGTMGPYTPARVLPGKIPQAGQLGFQTRTEHNKQILKIASDNITPRGGWVNYGIVDGGYLVLDGSVPGPKKRLIMLRKAVRSHMGEKPIKLESVSLESQQGV